MPELPEVETVRRTLVPLVVGRIVTSVLGADFPDVMGPGGLERSGSVLGREIIAIDRRGKYLAIDLDDATSLLVHLRMTGQLVAVRPDTPTLRFQHLIIGLASPVNDHGPNAAPVELRFADQRRFGRVLHIPRQDRDRQFSLLGPEPLGPDFSPVVLRQATTDRRSPIKNILLDQRRLAGLGNIYVDEALFRAGIHPLRTGGSLRDPELIELHAAIVTVLEESLARRGTTFSSFLDGYGDPGENGANLRVYGRARSAEPCVVCGTPLRLIRLAGRSTSYCPICQPVDDASP